MALRVRSDSPDSHITTGSVERPGSPESHDSRDPHDPRAGTADVVSRTRSRVPQSKAEATAQLDHIDGIHLQVPNATGMKRFTKKNRKIKREFNATQEWVKYPRGKYHEYIHDLVLAGWDNLIKLDEYMCETSSDPNIVVSVVDITPEYKLLIHPDITNQPALEEFMTSSSRVDSRVRLYLIEQSGPLQAGTIETLGSHLSLDARYFQWNVFGSTNLMSPAERHRAPFLSIGFTILKAKSAALADTEFFRVSVYVKPDEVGDGWTGVIIFSSHTPITLSTRFFTPPPPFSSTEEIRVPPPTIAVAQSFRQLYLTALLTGALDDLQLAIASPFYTLSPLFRLNHRCWDMVIARIRDCDRAQGGISNTNVTHIEEIKKTLSLVDRGGSWAWRNGGGEQVEERKRMMKEDFTHLINQADLMWEARAKWKEVVDRKRESRNTALTNSFTYIFVPISLMTGIFGMNVLQISGSNTNPNIWTFFVAVVGLNLLILVTLAGTHWVKEYRSRSRKPGFFEVIKFAVGKKYQ